MDWLNTQSILHELQHQRGKHKKSMNFQQFFNEDNVQGVSIKLRCLQQMKDLIYQRKPDQVIKQQKNQALKNKCFLDYSHYFQNVQDTYTFIRKQSLEFDSQIRNGCVLVCNACLAQEVNQKLGDIYTVQEVICYNWENMQLDKKEDIMKKLKPTLFKVKSKLHPQDRIYSKIMSSAIYRNVPNFISSKQLGAFADKFCYTFGRDGNFTNFIEQETQSRLPFYMYKQKRKGEQQFLSFMFMIQNTSWTKVLTTQLCKLAKSIPMFERSEIQKFEQLYKKVKYGQLDQIAAINQYTKDGFVFKIINRILRMSVCSQQLLYIQPIFRDIYIGILKLHSQQISKFGKQNDKFVCYRGGNVNFKQETFIFQCHVGQFVQILGFFSTSSHKQTAINFAKNILFIIKVECSYRTDETDLSCVYNRGYAKVNELSQYRDQQQIIFNPLNTFKIVKVKDEYFQQDDKQLKVVYLEFGDLIENQLKNINNIEKRTQISQIEIILYHKQKQILSRNKNKGNKFFDQISYNHHILYDQERTILKKENEQMQQITTLNNNVINIPITIVRNQCTAQPWWKLWDNYNFEKSPKKQISNQVQIQGVDNNNKGNIQNPPP